MSLTYTSPQLWFLRYYNFAHKPQARSDMNPHKKYLWKLERPRPSRYQCPEVYCYPSGKPVTLMATEAEAKEWAKHFDGWTLANG